MDKAETFGRFETAGELVSIGFETGVSSNGFSITLASISTSLGASGLLWVILAASVVVSTLVLPFETSTIE